MVGFADVLGKDTDELTDTDRAEMLAAVASQGFEIASIMDNLTVAARIDLADLFVESSPLEPAAEVAQVLGQLPAASAAQIRTTGTAPPALANSLRVRQVLRVMLSNAARHGKPPISISLSQRPGFVELSVIDHGEGVDPIDTQRIFSPYQTAPTDGTTPQSLGIGLYVGRYLARSMGGDLTYERRQDETMFCLTLLVASDTAT
jgi:signal transduction histidine kinase